MDLSVGRVVATSMDLNSELEAALNELAASDLTLARKKGSIYVTQTKEGLLALSYENGEYIITKQGVEPKVLAKGAPKAVKPVLASLYSLVEEEA